MLDHSSKQRTIFLLLDSGTSIRNIMRTDVFSTLKDCSYLKIIVFSPVHDESARDEFASDNVIVEPAVYYRKNVLQRFFRTFRKDLWAYLSNSDIYRKRRERQKGYSFHIALLKLAAWLFYKGDLERVLAWLMDVDVRFMPLNDHHFFQKYKPDLIFCTTIYSQRPCLELIANKRGIPILTMIHSWDNLVTKGPFPFRSDRIIVWNEIMKNQLINLQKFNPDGIRISGIPQSDIYMQLDRFLPKAEFFCKHGFDPERKLITYTTGTTGMVPQDHKIIEVIYRIIQRNNTIFPCQLLVRLHPKDNLDIYKRFFKLPNIFVQTPGRQGNTPDNWNPTDRDMFVLAELMLYSDIVINVASTITIDAAAFDTPIINVGFDGDETLADNKSCKRFYQFDHYRHIVTTGGAPIIYRAEDMTKQINAYLDNPMLDTEKRELIRNSQYWKLDGQAGYRVAQYIIEELESIE